MTWKFLPTILLLLIALSSQAQQDGWWGSARQRGLKGPVHVVTIKCSYPNRTGSTTQKYEFARDGKLLVITGPQAFMPHYIFQESRKVTKRNSHGDVEEVSFSLEGDVIRRNRGEYIYDDVGNWTKLVTSEMLTYTWDGGPPENTWRVKDVCTRDIEYYR